MKIKVTVLGAAIALGILGGASTAEASPPVIGTQPQSVTTQVGGQARFGINWTSDSACGSVSVQWQLNGVNLQDGPDISGSQNGVLLLTNLTLSQSGNYQAILTCTDGERASTNVAALLVVDAPTITSQPQPVTVNEGGFAELSVGYTYTSYETCGDVSFKWFHNSAQVKDDFETTGSATATLRLDDITAAKAGNYFVILECTASGGAVDTPLIPITMTASKKPAVTADPQPVIVDAGGSADFTVADTTHCAAGSFHTQWQLNGVDLTDGSHVSGSTTSHLHLSNVTSTQMGSYRALLTCTGVGWTVSKAAGLTVNPKAAPTVQPPIISTLTASPVSGGQSTISWTQPSGAASPELTLTPSGGLPVDVTGKTSAVVQPTSSTVYTLTATNSVGTYSQNVAVVVGSSTTISSCKAITAPGNYKISTNLTSSSMSTPCIDVHDTTDVHIQCTNNAKLTGPGTVIDTFFGEKTGGGIGFTNVHNFSVTGCTLLLPATIPNTAFAFGNIVRSSMGYLGGNTFGSVSVDADQYFQVVRSDYVTFTSNTIHNELDFWRSYGTATTNNTFLNSHFKLHDWQPYGIMYAYGVGSQAIGNSIDGQGTTVGTGYDDDIVGQDESGLLIAWNTLKNVFDGNIEFSGQMRSVTIVNNTIVRATYGFGTTYSASLAGSLIANNNISGLLDVTSIPNAHANGMLLSRLCAFRPAGYDGNPLTPQETKAFFVHNNFTGNVIVNNATAGPSDFWQGIPAVFGTCLGDAAEIPVSAWTLTDNVFKNNDFGTGVAAPTFQLPPVSGSITDGGGNKCTKPTPSGYPLVCH
ncbi:MAG TPA: immunoglobulin domain-containing protein [Polyangia bacterium]|nr:immunoglobulin domain-containing protein [Polyangia bacterium]